MRNMYNTSNSGMIPVTLETAEPKKLCTKKFKTRKVMYAKHLVPSMNYVYLKCAVY